MGCFLPAAVMLVGCLPLVMGVRCLRRRPVPVVWMLAPGWLVIFISTHSPGWWDWMPIRGGPPLAVAR
jgi:hypothetical protein